jgi:hypothetical protein
MDNNNNSYVKGQPVKLVGGSYIGFRGEYVGSKGEDRCKVKLPSGHIISPKVDFIRPLTPGELQSFSATDVNMKSTYAKNPYLTPPSAPKNNNNNINSTARTLFEDVSNSEEEEEDLENEKYSSKERPGYIYIMRAPQDDNYEKALKIGRSNNPMERVKDGQTWIPNLQVVACFYVQDQVAAEHEIHKKLDSYREKKLESGKEWFNCTLQQALSTCIAFIHEKYV